MDQARWLILLSVFLSMTVTLALLQKFSRHAPQTVEISASNLNGRSETSQKADQGSPMRKDTGVRRYREVKFSKPAAHTISVEGQSEFAGFEKLLQNEGKIIE